MSMQQAYDVKRTSHQKRVQQITIQEHQSEQVISPAHTNKSNNSGVLKQSNRSGGTRSRLSEKENMSVTSNTYQNMLSGSQGMAILKYLQDPEFGKYGESMKLIDTIQEFMSKIQAENEQLEEENKKLTKSNNQFSKIITTNQKQNVEADSETHQYGKHISDIECKIRKLDGKEHYYDKKDIEHDTSLKDLVEYVSWITMEASKLRQRVQKAEKMIADLRRSGEQSVESLLDTLYALRTKQEKLEKEANALRDEINQKEMEIKAKEDKKGELQQKIENENEKRNKGKQELKDQLAQQKEKIKGQRNNLNQLTALNEELLEQITRCAGDLSRKTYEKEQLRLQETENCQDQDKLKLSHNRVVERVRYMTNDVKRFKEREAEQKRKEEEEAKKKKEAERKPKEDPKIRDYPRWRRDQIMFSVQPKEEEFCPLPKNPADSYTDQMDKMLLSTQTVRPKDHFEHINMA